MKRILLAVTLVTGACLAAAGQSAASSPASVSIDLTTVGLRPDAASAETAKNCLYAYLGYRAVRWLDDRTVLVAFNLSPYCSPVSIHPEGKAKLVTFDLKGQVVHSAEFSYEPGIANATQSVPRDGVWIGPEESVLVNVPQYSTGKDGQSKGAVLVFSQDLNRQQELPTFMDKPHNKSFNFLGVAWDRQKVFFSAEKPATNEWSCRIYSGAPLTETGRCDLAPWDRVPGYNLSGLLNLPKGQEAAFVGKSSDESREVVFLQKKSDMCMLSQLFCTWQGTLMVIDRATRHRYFESKFASNARADISPDGTHLATFEKGKLSIISLP